MRKLYAVLFFLITCADLSAQHIEDNLQLLDSLLERHKNMHFLQSSTVGRSDSVWHDWQEVWRTLDPRYLYFDTDSICRQFVRKGYNAVADEMDYLYYTIFTSLPSERRAVEIKKMETIANATHSQALMNEVELQKALNLPTATDEQSDYMLQGLRTLQYKAQQRKDTLMYLRVRRVILHELRYHFGTYKALDEAIELSKIVDNVIDKQYFARNSLCFFIGELFYFHGYSEEAISITKKACRNANYFFESTNLAALNNLGIFYRSAGDLDLSDHYFRSMLESPDLVKYRGEYDAMAICNLGKNYLIRKDYKKAEQLLRKGLAVMVGFDRVFSTGVYVNLAKCFLAGKNLPQTKAMIDTVRRYIAENNPHSNNLYIELYPLMSKYYALIGDAKTSAAYTDSTVMQYVAYQKQYNDAHIFNVEKKLYDAEKKIKEEQLAAEKIETEKYRNMLIALLLMVFLSVGFYLFYLRFRRRKNRILYKRIMEESRIQAELDKAKLSLPKKDTILQRLETLMQTEKLFTDFEIDRKMVANRLSTNENYLTNAIRNAHNGQTFTEYVNSLRLNCARNLLQNNAEMSIKEVSFEAGFSSYKYFHKLFREEFGLSPSDFRAESKE
jgi:AraC-like DNA-binding protein